MSAPGKNSPASRTVAIRNEKGLHARAAARFVETAAHFKAEIEVSRDGQTVGGDSIMGLLMLAAAKGSEITIFARGPEAEDALNAICALVADGFGEDDQGGG